MPSWWGKPSSKYAKRKAGKESFIDAICRKFKIVSRDNTVGGLGESEKYSKDTLSDIELAVPRSESPSLLASRCQSFNECPHAQPQPLPLPRMHHVLTEGDDSGISTSRLDKKDFSKPVAPLSLLSGDNKPLSPDAWGEYATASVSSNSSMDTDDQLDSRLLSPLASDYDSGNVTAVNSPCRRVSLRSKKHKEQSPTFPQRILKDQQKAVNLPSNNHVPLLPKHGPLGGHMNKLQIPPHSGFSSAPDSSIPSPSRSPVSAGNHERVTRSVFYSERPHSDASLVASGHCSSPSSGQNSEHNSFGGDISLMWPQSRCSPECSPISSPQMTRPSSQIQSGGLNPLHSAGRLGTELSADRFADKKLLSHRLPLPAVTVPGSCPPSSRFLTVTSSSSPRNLGRAESSISPVSRWKKGRLIGCGTYGHVYLGFNSEAGTMCAMKEVVLFSDDTKSIESVQQLGQEIAFLSHLEHPNIVRYFGSEMVDDKLYIYLEYVAGGSIHKLLREYGQLGESAIRSYSQQILSGLAYLHAENTVHRDIKGANILVDPAGQVKLADFGMAKHMNGQPCQLSFKGSPYWMAPEVIRNSNGCNLGVDIWSLGCTVIEMATARPPWSQYEGVAALFKIGNSKELPAIPDHLSEEGKDFVRQCLQRDPLKRPTAVQLLEHPFVRNAASLERSFISSEPPPPLGNALCNADMGHNKMSSHLESQGALPNHFKSHSVSREPCMRRHLSCPVSPIGSPLLPLKSSQSAYRMRFPSTKLSPLAASASASASASAPSTRYTRARSRHFDHSAASSCEHVGVQRPQKSLCATGSTLCSKPRAEMRNHVLSKKITGKSVCTSKDTKELNDRPKAELSFRFPKT